MQTDTCHHYIKRKKAELCYFLSFRDQRHAELTWKALQRLSLLSDKTVTKTIYQESTLPTWPYLYFPNDALRQLANQAIYHPILFFINIRITSKRWYTLHNISPFNNIFYNLILLLLSFENLYSNLFLPLKLYMIFDININDAVHW